MKPKCEESLSNLAFNCNLRHYSEAITTAAQVLEWRGWARAHAVDVAGSRGVDGRDADADADALPPLESLLTEVDWIVEDAVLGVRDEIVGNTSSGSGSGSGSGVGGVWSGIRIGQLLDDNTVPRSSRQEVLLREDLDGLRRMWTTRLRDRMPVQYLTGSCHWRDLVLIVTPAVLIPRPETELMVDFVAEALKQRPALAHAPWADLGTGSGALAIGVAAEIVNTNAKTNSSGAGGAAGGAEARIVGDGGVGDGGDGGAGALVHAVDLSPGAVAVARHNARRNASLTGGAMQSHPASTPD